MNDYLAQLAETEVNPEETREILRRLAVDEFGGPDEVRIRDIAELTGTSPEVIGRMVAGLRGQDAEAWRKSIEDKLERQDRQLKAISQSEQWRSDQVAAADLRLWEEPGKQAIKFRPFKLRDFEFMLKAFSVLLMAIAIVGLIFMAFLNRAQ